MSRAVERVVTGIAITVASLVALMPPLTYMMSANDALMAVLRTEAEINGRIVSQIASANPTLWHFEVERLNALLARRPGEGTPEIRRLLDTRGSEITARADALESPTQTVSTPVFDSGREVARLEISRSQRPFLLVALGIALLSSLVAALAYLTLRHLPMRAHRTAVEQLEEARRESAEIQRARDQAEVRAQAAGAFLAQMSHEVRTPMNGIMGMIELTLLTEVSDEQRSYLDTAYSSASHLLRILNDILDVSRIEANKLELAHIPFVLPDIVRQSVRLMEPLALEKGLNLQLRLQEGLPDTVIGDDGRLRQILTNLIGNAIKFSPDGAVLVDVSAHTHRDGVPRIRFGVLDTGIGIEPAKLDTIFEAFTQADSSITRNYGGTGLGLNIVRRLVELMGGEVWVDSEHGKGSAFYFEVPFPIHAGS